MSADMHTMTGAYAAHALPPDEEADFERHLRECDTCPQEVRELEATAAYLGAALAVTPRAELRERVLAHIATVRQVPPRPSSLERRRPSWWTQPIGLAAAVLFVLSITLGGVVVDQRSQLSEAERTAQTIAAVVSDPARRQNTVAVESGTATVVSAGGQAVFLASDLPEPPSGRTYQLWTVADGGNLIRSAGVLDTEDGSTQALVRRLGDTEALAVSVEPDGGSEQPTPGAIVATLPLSS